MLLRKLESSSFFLATHALEYISKVSNSSQAHLLLGDMNALTREDYSAHQWRLLEERHQTRGWSPPIHSASLELFKDAGYQDAFQPFLQVHSSQVQHSDSNESIGDTITWKHDETSHLTAHVGAPHYRIDYAFLSPAFQLKTGLRVDQ
jgi:hypothetical protein